MAEAKFEILRFLLNLFEQSWAKTIKIAFVQESEDSHLPFLVLRHPFVWQNQHELSEGSNLCLIT